MEGSRGAVGNFRAKVLIQGTAPQSAGLPTVFRRERQCVSLRRLPVACLGLLPARRGNGAKQGSIDPGLPHRAQRPPGP